MENEISKKQIVRSICLAETRFVCAEISLSVSFEISIKKKFSVNSLVHSPSRFG